MFRLYPAQAMLKDFDRCFNGEKKFLRIDFFLLKMQFRSRDGKP